MEAHSKSDARSRFRERVARVCWATVTTPFAGNGSIDEPALCANLRTYASHFSSDFPIGFVACGTYGESLSMTDDERRTVIRATVDEAAGKLPVIAVVINGDSCLDRALDMVRFCDALGVDAVCVAPPTYYFKPTIAGLESWLSALSREVATGLVLYNLAGRFGYYMESHEVAQLAERIPSLVGMKLGAPSLEKGIEMIAAVGETIAVIEGAEPLAPETLPIGAIGYMASTAVFAPALMCEWTRAILERDAGTLAALQRRFARYRGLQSTTSAEPPSLLKAAMDAVGLAGGTVRLPLTALSEDEREELRRALQDLHLPIT